MYIKTFKFWCNKVLPLVYDDSLSYYEVLCKIYKTLNLLIESNNILSKELEQLLKDLPDMINDAIDEKLNSDEILDILSKALNLTRTFDTAEEMINSNTTLVGVTYKTNGYHSVNDGGDGFYKCVDESVNTGYILQGNNRFQLIANYINPMCVGAYGDGVHDDRDILESALTYCFNNNINFKSPKKTYLIRNNQTQNEAKFLRIINQTDSQNLITVDFGDSTILTDELSENAFLICINTNYTTIKNAVLNCNGCCGILIGSHIDTENSQTRNSVIENIIVMNSKDGFVFKDSSNNVLTKNLSVYNSDRGIVYDISHVPLSDGNHGYSFSNVHEKIYLYGVRIGMKFRSCQNILCYNLTEHDTNNKLEKLITGGHETDKEIIVSNILISGYGSQNISFNEQYVDIENVDGFLCENTNCLVQGNFYGNGFFGSSLLQGLDLYHRNYQHMNFNIDASGQNTLVSGMTNVTHGVKLRQNHNVLQISGYIIFTNSGNRTPFFEIKIPENIFLNMPTFVVCTTTETIICISSVDVKENGDKYLKLLFNGLDDGTRQIYFNHSISLIPLMYR